ncbi:MAG: hypothetical protein WCJ09_29110 [Planctomycetota bacterium]
MGAEALICGHHFSSGDLVDTATLVGALQSGHLAGATIDVMKPNEPGWNFLRAATWGKAIYGRNLGK